jgi:DNA-binding MarR family transcriptional regulator
MATTGWLDESEATLWQAYRDLGRELQRAFDRQLAADASVSGAEYALLVPLSEAPDGVVRMRDLGLAVGWERSRLSHMVSRMEKRGLLLREDCADDARGFMVRLTAEGRTAIEAAAPGHVATVRRYFFDSLSERERASMTRVFTRLIERLDRDSP